MNAFKITATKYHDNIQIWENIFMKNIILFWDTLWEIGPSNMATNLKTWHKSDFKTQQHFNAVADLA